LGKTADPSCSWGHHTEDGFHITLECPRFRKERTELLERPAAWEDLDAPKWAKEGEEEPYDRVEAFFGYIFTQIT